MNDGDQALNFVYLVGVLVLVASSLAVRRLPIGQTLKMAAAWLLIFAALFAVVALKDDFVALGKHIWSRGSGQSEVVETGQGAGKQIRIRKSPDGHFWVYGRVNGEKVHFLIDSGATVTSISVAAADRAGIDHSGGFPALVSTANGMIQVQRGRAETLKIGSITRHDIAVHVSESFGDTNVLGMNFLSSLSGWGVEGPWLVLKA
jgi:aspartyl protease family protein